MCRRSGSLRLSCFGFRGLCQLEPFPFPTRLVPGLNFGAGTGDVEYIAAALLSLRHETERLAAEGMIRCEEVKHCVSLRFRQSDKS